MRFVMNTVRLSSAETKDLPSYIPIVTSIYKPFERNRPNLYRISNQLRPEFSEPCDEYIATCMAKLHSIGITDEFLREEYSNRIINNDWAIDDVYCEKRKNVAGYIGKEVCCIRFEFKIISESKYPFIGDGLTNFKALRLGDKLYFMTKVESGHDKRWRYKTYCEVYKVPLELWDIIRQKARDRKRGVTTFIFSDDPLDILEV